MEIFPLRYKEIIGLLENIDPVAYANSRNFADGKVTRLSPYLSRGVITLPMVRETIFKKGFSTRQSMKLLQELAWREYYQRVWRHLGNGIFTDVRQPMSEFVHQRMITAVTESNTRIEVIDRCIHELYRTGYMHNHARMYVAALTCNVGKAYWKQPSEWLYYHLLDGDIASNTLSWQWVAGSFAGKKYFANQDNINKYFYDSQRGSYLDTSYEELAQMDIPEVLAETHNLKFQTVLPEKRIPALNHNLPLLLYNSYHLNPEWRKDEPANRVLLLEPSHFSRFPVSSKVLDFILGLSENIEGLQVFTGNIGELPDLEKFPQIISMDHPLTTHYPGVKDDYPWMFPAVNKFYKGFFPFWKNCERFL